MENIEIWLPIKQFEGIYEISSFGNIRNCKKVIKKLSIDNNGYVNVSLYNNGLKHATKLHRLVAEHFIENPYNKSCVNHIDGNKLNNNIANLEWCTHSENTQHAIRNGLLKFKCGGSSHKAKLTDKQVEEIYQMLVAKIDYTTIANKYNITTNHVAKIKSGKYFKNIVQPELPKKVIDTLTNEQIADIKQMVKKSIPYTKISLKYGIDRKLLANCFPR